ncbi:S1C family serine protease [Haloferula sargassicola]|uniref:PDZ domain-containing protein n=1 Tax=Haloferula sargassicola TaxID=490096 RepID=A0ABP9UMB8_9BACT
MKTPTFFPILALAVPPLMAIEPPVDSTPIPPRQAPATVDDAASAPRAVPAPRPVEMASDPAPPAEGQAYLGVVLEKVPDFLSEHLKLAPGQGVIVGGIVDGGPASEAGLQKNDVILKVNNREVGARQDVIDITGNMAVGDQVAVEAIQGGETKEFTVVLGARPTPPDIGSFQRQGFGLDEQGLNGLPDRHRDLLRDALERNMQLLEQFDEEMPQFDHAIPNDMMKRLSQQMSMQSKSMSIQKSGLNSSIRFTDDEGSVELSNDGSGKKAKVSDRDGKVLWEGPYETEEDKAAAPEPIRQRMDQMDFGALESMDGNGIRFRFNKGGRYRTEDQLEAPKGLEDPAPAGD